MRLHENEKLFRQATEATAQQLGIQAIYVEKDYWVPLALKAIFTSSAGENAVFKGGTSLSKCYGLIDRFSEDIDIVIYRHPTDTDNKLKNRIKQTGNAVAAHLAETDKPGITRKMGQIRKTAHEYPLLFSGSFGQVKDYIVLEVTWLGYHEPNSVKPIKSLISEMMLHTGQQALITEYELDAFNLKVLDITRTFCEKLVSLIRFSFTQNPIEALKAKIRHLYDIHKLMQTEEIKKFLYSAAFFDMMKKVYEDDATGIKNDNTWLNLHPAEAMIFKQPDETWQALRSTYSYLFKSMVYGILPKENDILATITEIAKRIKQIPG